MFKFKSAKESKLAFSKDFLAPLNEDWDLVFYKNKLLSPEVLEQLIGQGLKKEIEQELIYIPLNKLFVAIPASVINIDEFWAYLAKSGL